MESYSEVVEPLFSVIDFGGGPQAFARSIALIPRSSFLLFSAHMCLAEVHNGGFLQLFWNNTGLLVPEGIQGLATIGMPLMAAILREAALPLGSPYPRDRDERWEALLGASAIAKQELMKRLKKIEKDPDNTRAFYAVFVAAAENLRFGKLEKQFLETAGQENGGFQEVANRFAKAPRLLQ